LSVFNKENDEDDSPFLKFRFSKTKTLERHALLDDGLKMCCYKSRLVFSCPPCMMTVVSLCLATFYSVLRDYSLEKDITLETIRGVTEDYQ